MPAQINQNVSPYYDDFDPSKNYYKVMYKPGFPIQARELTTAQSITADQIEQLANRILVQGDNVVPGEFTYQNNVPYVKLSQLTQNASAKDFIGARLTGATSGVSGIVVWAENQTDTDAATIFINYDNSGASTESGTFSEGEVLESDTDDALTAVVGVSGIVPPIDTPAMGSGSVFTVKAGVYFIGGYMVRNLDETITLEKYSTNVNNLVGFIVTEEFVNSNEDPSLLDNAQGSSNFAAPGADRLKITLALSKLALNTTTPNFVRLATVVNGNLQGSPDETVKWDWLYDILARRTFNESGNYIVTEFPIKPLEYINTDTQEGVFNANTDGTFPGVPDPTVDPTTIEDITATEAESLYALNVGAGLAYVQGYEVGYETGIYKYGKKARDTDFRENAALTNPDGAHIFISDVYGLPDFENITSVGNAVALDDVVLYKNFTDGYTGEATIALGDGSLRPQNLGNEPQTTYHIICDTLIGQTGYTEVYREGRSAVVTGVTGTISRGDTIGGATVLVAIDYPAIPVGVATPKYIQPSDILQTASGDFYTYNSEYKLGLVTSRFFTQLNVVEKVGSVSSWTVGDLVVGENSGASGVLESGSVSTSEYSSLILSNVVGEFEAGEDVIQGSNYATVFRDGEISSLQFPDAGTSGNIYDLSNETTVTVAALGASVDLTVAAGEITSTQQRIDLTQAGRDKLFDFANGIATASQRRFNYTVTTTPNNVTGYAISPAPFIINSSSSIKSFFSALNAANDFSANISGTNTNHLDNLVVADSGLFTGDASTNFVTCNDYAGDPSKELIFGDIVSFVDDEGATVTKQVLFATQPSGYGSLRTPSFIYFTTNLLNGVTGKQISRVRSKTFGNSSDSLVYTLPQEAVKTLESNPEDTNINYQVFRQFYVNYNSGGTQVAISTSEENEQFIGSTTNLLVSISSNRSGSDDSFFEGRFIVPNSVETEDNGRKLVINLDSIPASLTLKIVAPVSVSDGVAKRKTLVNATGADAVTLTLAQSVGSVVSLGRTDVFDLVSVKDANGVNVTDNYEFDDGQRDNIYDISRLILKENRPAAKTALTVEYRAFDHSVGGDFFSVDSYTHDAGVSYNEIPTYKTSSAIYAQFEKEQPPFIYLRDCVDFRPSVNTTGDASVIARITPGVDEQNAKNFKDTSQGGNADVPRFLVPGSLFFSDIEYYLARIDALMLDRTGELRLRTGTSAINPVPPPDESTAIRLYDINLPAYTPAIDTIYIKKYNYHRYRMSDISKIDKRVKNLEDVVTLSLLEQAAVNMSVSDSVTGLDRFKNGYIVDSFVDHRNGLVSSPEYTVSVEPKKTTLNPGHFDEQVTLEESAQTDAQRGTQGYQRTGALMTLPYSNVEFVKNPFATRTVNLQPFSVFVYEGEITLQPEIDTWQEVRVKDALVVEDNSLFDAMTSMTDALVEMGLGTTSTSTSQNIVTGSWSGGRGGSGRPIRVTQGQTITTTVTETLDVIASNTVETSLGERVVDVQVAQTMRSTPVYFTGVGLKPKTKYYVYFDDVNVGAWVGPDAPEVLVEDGSTRIMDVPGSNLQGFGSELISDDFGNCSGVFIIPRGHAPLAGTVFTTMEDLQYDETTTTRSFNTGTKTLRITTSEYNRDDVEAIAESDFTSSGVIVDKQETVVSTRVPEVGIRTDVNVTTSTWQTAQEYDPVAQTFLVDENNPNGVFVTELDAYFESKDEKETVYAYLVTTEGHVPTEEIIPFSLVKKQPDTILRTKVTLGAGVTSESLPAGTVLVGQTSGARGTLKTTTTFVNSASDVSRNVTNTVYNVICDNYVNDFVSGEVIVPEVSPALTSTFTIVGDEFKVNRLDIRTLGSGYTTATASFSDPDLPGGVAPTATVTVADGKVVKITLDTVGSGYTSVPSCTINGDGTGATVEVRTIPGMLGAAMGVATSKDATAPTKFKFPSPVYLLGNTNYAVVLKSPSSVNYKTYLSRMGENLIGADGAPTDTKVTSQPLLGSIFRSQNGGLWTEDQNEDLMFTLYRADFATNVNANIQLQNAPLTVEAMDLDPIETNSTSASNPEDPSNSFGDNPKIIKVYSKTHGLLPGDLVFIQGVQGYGAGNDINGVPASDINTIHTVLDADFNTFTVEVSTEATDSGKAGGSLGKCSFNRPFESVRLQTGAIFIKDTDFTITNRAAGCAGITGSGYRPYRLSSSVEIKPEEIFYYNNPQQAANYLNEANFSGTGNLQGRRSLLTTITMATTDSKVSPVFDFDRTNMVCYHNLINKPEESDGIYGAATRTITFDNNVNFTANSRAYFDVEGTTRSALVTDWNSTTKKLKLRGAFARYLATATDLFEDLAKSTSVTPTSLQISRAIHDQYVPETQNDSSSFCKWVSREFLLENVCDGLELKMSAIMYSRDDIKLYYKPRVDGYDGSLTDINWIPFNGTGLCDNNNQVRVRSSDVTSPASITDNDFTEYTWSIQDVPEFIGFSLKVVLTADNPAKSPMIDDIRCIASE